MSPDRAALNAETRKFLTAVCLLLFFTLPNVGCTYHGTLRSDFFRHQDGVIDQKIPLTVALVKSFDESVFQHRGEYSVEIQLAPGLIDASQKALETAFVSVSVIDNAHKGGNHDLLALLHLTVQETYRNYSTGQVGFNVNLALTFKDQKSRTLVSTIQTSTAVDYVPSGETWTATYLTGYSMFLLSPATIPWTTNSIGRTAEGLIEETIGKLLRTALRIISHDDSLANYVSAKQSGSTFSKATPKEPPSKGPKSSGSGFVVSRDGHILTNQHVVESCSRIEVTIQGQKETTTLLQADQRNDLALLKLKAAPTAVAMFREGKIRAGDSVVAIGFPLHGLLSTEATVTAGVISSLTGIAGDSRMLQITAPIQPGNSGGPLIDMNGSIIGMVVAQLDAIKIGKLTGTLPQNVNFALSSTLARSFLDSIGVEYQTANKSSRMEVADIADRSKKFSALIQCFD